MNFARYIQLHAKWYAVICVKVQQNLKKYMSHNRLSQKDMAKHVGVSQSTISRALKRKHQRRTVGLTKIEQCIFQHNVVPLVHNASSIPAVIAQAISSLWDQSEGHAKEIARVLNSLDGLKPKR